MKKLVLLCIVSFVAVGTASADIIFDDTASGTLQSLSLAVSGENWGGYGNTVSTGLQISPSQDYSLDSLTVWARLIEGVNSLTISIQTDSSGIPSGDILESWLLNDQMGSSPTALTVSSLGMSLLGGAKYWVVLSPNDASTLAGWAIFEGTEPQTTAQGDPYGVWGPTLRRNAGLVVTGTPVPEPDGLVLLIVPLLLIIMTRGFHTPNRQLSCLHSMLNRRGHSCRN